MALTAMLVFDGVMEMERIAFVENRRAEDPQPVIDNKAIGTARERTLIRQHNAFMSAWRRYLSLSGPPESAQHLETGVSSFLANRKNLMTDLGARKQFQVVSITDFPGDVMAEDLAR